MHTNNLSSDDEDDAGQQNRIGPVPLHWYNDYEHIRYDTHGFYLLSSTGNVPITTGVRLSSRCMHMHALFPDRFLLKEKHLFGTETMIVYESGSLFFFFAKPDNILAQATKDYYGTPM